MEGQHTAVSDLSSEESSQVRGGSPLQIATLIVGAFGAGFKFGYYDLAPRLFD